jgi:hypothetical protein
LSPETKFVAGKPRKSSLGHRKCHDVAEKVDLLFTPKAKPSNIMEDTDIEDKGRILTLS